MNYNHGFHWDYGKKTGYDIYVDGLGFFECVSYKDKGRLIREFKELGYTDNEINVNKVNRDF